MCVLKAEEVRGLVVNTVMRLGLNIQPDMLDIVMIPLLDRVEEGDFITVAGFTDWAETEFSRDGAGFKWN